MANVFKRGGRWYWRFFHNGKVHRGTAGPEATKKMADDLLKAKIREVTGEDINGKPLEPITFAEFADHFFKTCCQTREKDGKPKASADRDLGTLAMLKDHWGKVLRLDAITTEMIAAWKAERSQFRKPGTVAREMGILNRLFDKALQFGRLRVHPMATVKKPLVKNSRVAFKSPEEIVRLRDALEPLVRERMIFAHYTGARWGSIDKLVWSDVNLKAGTLVLRETKNGEDHMVIINATARALLESLPKPVSKSQRVFPPVNKVRFNRAWKRACRAARIGKECACKGQPLPNARRNKKCPACRSTGIIPDFKFHDLRHQGATDLIERGATLYDVQHFLGHKSPTMTQRYAHMVEARRRQTAFLLDQPAPEQEAAKG